MPASRRRARAAALALAVCSSLLAALLVHSGAGGRAAGRLLPLERRSPAAARAGVAPSLRTPGGLSRGETPQFVLLTNDDAVFNDTHSLISHVIGGRHANGCPLAFTLFAMLSGTWPYDDRPTDCALLKDLWQRGCEVADHGVSHVSLLAGSAARDERLDRARWGSVPAQQVAREILGGRELLSSRCGIPAAAIVGHRSPYLEQAGAAVRAVLHRHSFLYESTLIEPDRGSFSQGFGNRLWPFDMRHGIPIACGVTNGGMQTCNDGEAWPGLWEVPVWQLTQLGGPYDMDPLLTNYITLQPDADHSVLDVLRANFEAAYAGNRAPLPVFVHGYWLAAGDNAEQLGKFVDYAASKPDVFFVTMRQLIAWMQHPRPAEQLAGHPELLGCGLPGGSGPA